DRRVRLVGARGPTGAPSVARRGGHPHVRGSRPARGGHRRPRHRRRPRTGAARRAGRDRGRRSRAGPPARALRRAGRALRRGGGRVRRRSVPVGELGRGRAPGRAADLARPTGRRHGDRRPGGGDGRRGRHHAPRAVLPGCGRARRRRREHDGATGTLPRRPEGRRRQPRMRPPRGPAAGM
ncbi:MAG: hypothetical protein AVDCRST_MAG30-1328, partial [uncultured Solirubrobacteraceae bacterium]